MTGFVCISFITMMTFLVTHATFITNRSSSPETLTQHLLQANVQFPCYGSYVGDDGRISFAVNAWYDVTQGYIFEFPDVEFIFFDTLFLFYFFFC